MATDPDRALIEPGNSCGDYGWSQGGDFYAYTSPKPGTERYCYANDPDRAMIEKDAFANCGDNGWTNAGEFWAYPLQ